MPQNVNTAPALASPGARLPKSTVRQPAPPPANPGSLAGLQQLASEPFVEPRVQDPFTLGSVMMQEPDIEPVEDMFAALNGQQPAAAPSSLGGLADLARRARRR